MSFMNQKLSLKSLLCFLTIASCSFLQALSREDFNLFTYKEPPIVMYDEGVLYGVGTDVINKALEEMGIEDYYIKLYPKKRAEFYAKRDSGTMYFPALRTEGIEKDFVLVGPIIMAKVFAYSLTPREVHSSWEDFLKADYKIAVASGSRQLELIAQDYTPLNIQALPSEESNIEKLKNDRVDVWVTTDLNAAYLKQRKEVKNLYPIYEFEGYNDLYLAINNNTNPDVLKTFEKVFNQLNEKGVIMKIQSDFLRNLEIWSQSSF